MSIIGIVTLGALISLIVFGPIIIAVTGNFDAFGFAFSLAVLPGIGGLIVSWLLHRKE